MAVTSPSLRALLAELAEMRALLAAQGATIDQQQVTIAALREDLAAVRAQQPTGSAAPEAQPLLERQAQAVAEGAEPRGRRAGVTSRRGLLRGAAAGAAAATVGAVALNAGQPAHAAPQATGSSLILGKGNDANATTSLSVTSAAAAPASMLQVNTNSTDPNGAAIFGNSTSGSTGVYGSDANNGNGLSGFAAGASGYGVQGLSDVGYGVVGASTTGIDFLANGQGRILQGMQSQVGIPSGNFLAGESIRDANGDLWLCIAGDGSTQGTWVRVAHLAPGAAIGGAITYLTEPIRLLDTRIGATDAHQTPHKACQPNAFFTVTVAGVSFTNPITSTLVSVPATAVGAIGNVTVVTPTSTGFVALVPSGAGFTGTSNVNYSPGVVVPNCFNVPLSGGGFDIYVDPHSAQVDVLIDLFAVIA